MRSRLAGACVVTAAVVALAPTAASARPADAHAAAKPKITLSGSTSVAPLASKLDQGLSQGSSPARPRSRSRRAARTSASPTSRAGRVSIGNSSRDPKPTDPGGLRVQQDRPRRDLHRHQPEQHARRPLAGAGPGHLLRQGPRLEPGARRDRVRPDRPGRPHRGLRYAGRVPEDLHGQTSKVAERRRRRRPTASSRRRSTATRTRSATCRSRSPKACTTLSYKGVACNLRNAKSGQYPGSRNFWMVTRGTPARKSAVGKFIRWIQRRQDGQQDHRDRLGPARLVTAGSRTAAQALERRPRRASARRARVARPAC